MANRANLVNLDAMITREDFAVKSSQSSPHYDKQDKISIRDFTADGLLGSLLRKPDFQRETNHWTPEQVVSLLRSEERRVGKKCVSMCRSRCSSFSTKKKDNKKF